VEQGAFDGQLAEDVLSALRDFAPACFDATTLHLVEPLARLRQNQMSKLSHFKNRVVWHLDLESLPSFCGVHYSNELLDAFPVHRLRFTSDGWREWRVDTCGKTLVWVETQITDDAVKGATRHLCDRETGAFGEVCVGYAPHLEAVGAKLKNGWMLSLDYGMSGAELALPIRRDGTISAYREQRRVENLLANPGEQDLTAHVNFSSLAIQAMKTGWTLEGYTEQNRFFTGLAPLHFRDAIANLTQEEQRELLAFRTLTHPQLMGFQFKAFCLGRKSGTRSAGGGEALWEELPRLCGFGLTQNPKSALMLQDASFW
jgi:SAM-dependent MidA family methyltransferase